MQEVTQEFFDTTEAGLRKISSKIYISFKKDYDASIDFFEVGTSLIGGTDLLKGTQDVVQEWDKFDYEDFSDRIISINYNREVDQPTSSITVAQAQFVLNNSDGLFTPSNSSSSLGDFILPRRPVKVLMGFNDELLQVFVGLTVGLPVVDEKSKTATFNCVDFMTSFINKPLDEAVIYEDLRSDEIIQNLLEDHAGLLSSQFDLDTGTITIPFAYFPKGTTIKDGIDKVVSADLGNFFVDENGVTRFQNRVNWLSNTKVWDFSTNTVLDIRTPGEERIINVAEVFSNVRAVQSNQKIWELESAIEVPAGDSVDIFANFSDNDGDIPTTAVDDPVYIDSKTTSLYATNEKLDGSGAPKNGDISLDDTTLFSTSFKMEFSNSGAASVFITQIELFGTPAKVIKHIYIREQNDASIGTSDGFDEKLFRIDNDFIQDDANAESIALTIINDRGDFDDQREIIVMAVPQLQIGDVVNYTDKEINEDYYVTRINGTLTAKGGFTQLVELTQRTIESYFIIGVSTIEGGDKIGP